MMARSPSRLVTYLPIRLAKRDNIVGPLVELARCRIAAFVEVYASEVVILGQHEAHAREFRRSANASAAS